jgi:uncharacterized caspase-like protein
VAGRYRALLIGNSTYPADEHNLQPLKGPARDIAALNRALVDPATGMFTDGDVTLLPEVSSPRALRALGAFFGNADRDDVLLLYFSGHGKLDLSGRLHLCMQDTETTDLLASAVSSTRINEFVEASRARNAVIVLDCCYAGAFRGGDFGDAVAGPGRYVLTSCRGTQLANDATDDGGTSHFTQHLVDGLTHAAEDKDGDGFVSFSDLYAFVDRQLRSEGKQIPQRRVDGDGDLRMARRTRTASTDGSRTAIAPAAPGASPEPPRSRPARTRALLVGGALGMIVVVVAAVLLATRGAGAFGDDAPGTHTADGPWRLVLRDTFQGNDPGCSITLTDTGSRDAVALPTGRVFGSVQWQIHRTGTLRWQVNDPRCVVTALEGTGSGTLPVTLPPTIGDSDAFPVASDLAVRVTDFSGNPRCRITLVDAATGAPVDASTATAGQAPDLTLHPGAAASVYVNPGGCGVSLAARQ